MTEINLAHAYVFLRFLCEFNIQITRSHGTQKISNMLQTTAKIKHWIMFFKPQYPFVDPLD